MCVRCVWKSPRRHARRQPGIALCFDGLGQRHECGAVLAASCAARGAASVNPRNRRSGASMSASTWRSAGPSVPISMSASGIGLSHVRGQARSGATSTGRAVLRRGAPRHGRCRQRWDSVEVGTVKGRRKTALPPVPHLSRWGWEGRAKNAHHAAPVLARSGTTSAPPAAMPSSRSASIWSASRTAGR